MATIEERTGRDGKAVYRARVRLKGHPAQSATFDRKTDARRWIASTEAAIREGRHFKTSEAKRRTLAEAIDRYAREVLPRKPKSGPKQAQQLDWWRAQIGAYALADVTTATLSECRSKLLAEPAPGGRARTPATANRYMAALSHVLTIAAREWEWIETNPCARLARLSEPRGRVRFLDDGERARLLAACKASPSAHLYPVVVLALSTGARLNEVLGLRWPQVDVGAGRIVLHDTKNTERRVLPLAGHAREVIREWGRVRRVDTDLLFPNSLHPDRPIDIRGPWNTALAKAGIADFRFHDLRHSAASYLAMNGATLAEIAEVLGHKTLQMVKRYAHLSEARCVSRAHVAMLDNMFGESKILIK
ncbi:MAG TPA: integrase [Rhodospirillaceae bacterium]|jgi:integrase|nr:site-specific integrase [Alphaproteobacteria bacterium]HBH25846.1 integrase [Rhodospirillaceae bacterium]